MDLPEFLLARIAEDESVARRAEESPGSYRGHPTKTAPLWTVSAASAYGREVGPRGSVEATPGRVLAECAAKRALIDQAFQREAVVDGEWACCHDADEIRAGLCPEMSVDEIPELRIMAAVWADHPGYRAEWRADG